MYAYSHSGLGQVDETTVDLGSGVMVIGAIALIALLLIGTGDEPMSQGGRKKAKKRRGVGSTRTIYKKAAYKGGFFGDEEEEPVSRKKYASYMAKKHKLTAAEQRDLEEHEE